MKNISGQRFEPKSFQVSDQEYLAECNYTALLSMEPGAGKTATALLAHKNSGAKVTLVVAPEATHGTAWIPQAEQILGITPRVIGNTGRKAVKEAMFDFKMGYPGIYIVTPQLLTREKDLSEWVGDMCIVDEGHYINKPKSLGQKQMQKLGNNFPKHRLFLSGTAWRNNFERAWSVMRFLFPDLMYRYQVAHDNFRAWQYDRMLHEEVMVPPRKWYPTTWEKYKDPPVGYWRKNINGVPHIGEPIAAKQWLNESEPGKLLSEAPGVIIHKKREECCEHHTVARQGFAGFLDLEEPQVIEHVIDLTPKQSKAIQELEDQYLTWLKNNPLVVELPISLQQRIRQITLAEPEVEDYVSGQDEDGEDIVKQRVWFEDNCKSPYTEQLLDILEADEDEPVVVYLEHQSYAGVLVNKLNKAGFPAFEFSGKTKSTRNEDLQEFGKKYKVAVVVISAGSTGLDGLQRVSKTEVWMERSLDETNNVQARSRQDRLGGRGQVQRHIFLDSQGRAEGKYSEALARQIALNATLRKQV